MKIANAMPIVNTIRKPVDEGSQDASIKQSSKDMESVFLSMVMKSMQKTLGEGALGNSQNNLASMLFSSVLGEAIASGGGIGLADKIADGLSAEGQANIDAMEPELNPLMYQKIKFDGEW